MTVYFISGLGADKRAFQKIQLPSHFNIMHVSWISPLKKETLSDYVKRLTTQINITEDFSLVGLSFGGIVATELSKIINPKQIILISSVSLSDQIPWYYRVSRYIPLHLFLPATFLKSSNSFIYWLFGVSNNEEKQLLKNILRDTDVTFLKWAITKISVWNNKIKAQNLYHIHGTVDKIFPIKKIKPDFRINGGGHFMVLNKHKEISEILSEKLIL